MPTKIDRIVKPAYSKKGAHVKVEILRTGRYSDFSTPPKVGARKREAGEAVDFPAGYANSIIASGLAKPFSKPDVTGGAEVEIQITDAARKLAETKDVDLAQVEATGQGRRILLSDVQRFLEG